jgi:integrase
MRGRLGAWSRTCARRTSAAGLAPAPACHGEDLAVVSRILGHSSISTTADVYAHLTRGMQDRAAQRMDGILRRTG